MPPDLKDWLYQIGLSQYGPLLVDQGFDDLSALVQMVSKDRIMPLTEETLIEAGIRVTGHRKRLLVQLELLSGGFERNTELMNYLIKFAKQKIDQD